jgi:hypothetical protein
VVKDRGIADGVEYRDKVCPEQTTEKLRLDCKTQAEKFISYRRIEKKMIETILDAFDSNVFGKQTIATNIIPTIQMVAKLGTESGNRLDQLYPRSKSRGKR